MRFKHDIFRFMNLSAEAKLIIYSIMGLTSKSRMEFAPHFKNGRPYSYSLLASILNK